MFSPAPLRLNVEIYFLASISLHGRAAQQTCRNEKPEIEIVVTRKLFLMTAREFAK